MKFSMLRWIAGFLGTVAVLTSGLSARGQQYVVPGTGQKMTQVGDDFEDPNWQYIFNLPKSSKNLNKYTGGQGGESKNGRWYEGVKRGQPDQIERVAPPPNGLLGSEGAMLLRSRDTGVPGRPSYKLQQDDFICDINYKLGGSIPVHQSPNVVVHVFLPPMKEWERRTGPSFAFRCAVETLPQRHREEEGQISYGRETYWPGMFIEFQRKEDTGTKYDALRFRIRADESGRDFISDRKIETTGWWTLGLSVTPDGRIHYYGKPGVEPLTADDVLAPPHHPYGNRADRFNTFFFNVCNGDDGRTWSTPWIVDDCEVYFIPTSSPRVSANRR